MVQKGINFSNNPPILNSFLLYLANIKGFSIETIKGYETDLRTFFKFILKYKETKIAFKNITIFLLFQINTDDIYAFLVYINYEKNNCSSTRKRKLSALKAFFKWLYLNNPNQNKENPAKKIPSIELNLRLPKYLTLEEAKKIQSVFNITNSKKPIRNNTIITLFLSTGIRISELININTTDIDFRTNSIRIIGKGNKERIVYFSNYCKKQLKKYLDVRTKTNTEALFISCKNKRVCKSTVENICKQAFTLIGVGSRHYSPHTLRHTAATIFYESSNYNLLLVKEILGHSSIVSTEIYTHVKNKEIQEAVNKNPLGNYMAAS